MSIGDSHEVSCLIFFEWEKMSKELSSAAVVIGVWDVMFQSAADITFQNETWRYFHSVAAESVV